MTEGLSQMLIHGYLGLLACSRRSERDDLFCHVRHVNRSSQHVAIGAGTGPAALLLSAVSIAAPRPDGRLSARSINTFAGMAHHKIHDRNWTGLPLLPHLDPQPRELHP